MYKNIVFDVYGTLIDIYTDETSLSVWEQMAKTMSFYGVNYGAAELCGGYFGLCKKYMDEGMQRHEYPEVDVVKVFADLFANKGKKAGEAFAERMAQQFRIFSLNHLSLYPNVTATLHELKRAGKKLYVLSNAQACFTKVELATLGLTNFFSGIAYSSDYACSKPSAEFFDAFMKKYNLSKSETLYVGNDARCDVDGANNCGIDTLWIKSNLTDGYVRPTTNPTFVVENGDFIQIAEIVENCDRK